MCYECEVKLRIFLKNGTPYIAAMDCILACIYKRLKLNLILSERALPILCSITH